MKRLPIILTLFAALLVPLAPAAQAQAKAVTQDTVETPDAIAYVDGLACPFCAYGLEKKLKNLDALRAMEVQLEKGRVLLAFKQGKTLSKEQIQTAVKKAGFTARKIEFPGQDAPSGSR